MSSFLTIRTPIVRSSTALLSRTSAHAAFPSSYFSLPPCSNLHTSSARRALNESDRNRDDNTEDIEFHKEESLRKQRDAQGHWKQELASNSEASVKADRGDIEATDESIKKLQKETEKISKKVSGS